MFNNKLISVLFFLICSLILNPAFSASTPNIQVSRTSGVAPLAVFFDATGTTSTSTNQPFHELHYVWDFDDPNSGNWSITDRSKNTAYGPVAAHVFESPGTYNVVLTVRETNGGVSTRQVTITVQNPNNVFSGAKTVCFSTSGNFNGCPSGAKHVTTSSLTDVQDEIGSGKRLLVRSGETFPSGAGGQFEIRIDGPGHIGSYGPGRARINAGVQLHTPASDWRITDLEMTGGDDDMLVAEYTPDLLFMNNTGGSNNFDSMVNLNNNVLQSQNRDLPRGIFIIENDVRNIRSTGMYIAAKDMALMGNLIDGVPGSHGIRVSQTEHAVISNNYLARQRNGSGLLTLRAMDKNGDCIFCPDPSRYIVVSDNYFYPASANGIGVFVGRNSSGQTPEGYDLIFERNFTATDPGTSNVVRKAFGVTQDAKRVTIRNNVVNMDGWQAHDAFTINGDDVWVYNNSCYGNENEKIYCVRYNSGSGAIARNNLTFGPNAINSLSGGGLDSMPNDGSNLLLRNNPFVSSSLQDFDDFELKSGSPAINMGISAPVVDDLFNNIRPSGSQYDVGAVESGASGGSSGSGGGTSGGSSSNNPPTAVIVRSPESGSAALVVEFDGSNSTDSDGDPLTYHWDLDDGTIMSTEFFTHTYTEPGTYNIVLTVEDGNGGSDQASVTVSVASIAGNIILSPDVEDSGSYGHTSLAVTNITPSFLQRSNELPRMPN